MSSSADLVNDRLFTVNTTTTKFPKPQAAGTVAFWGGHSSPGHHRRHPELHVAGSLTFGFETGGPCSTPCCCGAWRWPIPW